MICEITIIKEGCHIWFEGEIEAHQFIIQSPELCII